MNYSVNDISLSITNVILTNWMILWEKEEIDIIFSRKIINKKPESIGESSEGWSVLREGNLAQVIGFWSPSELKRRHSLRETGKGPFHILVPENSGLTNEFYGWGLHGFCASVFAACRSHPTSPPMLPGKNKSQKQGY